VISLNVRVAFQFVRVVAVPTIANTNVWSIDTSSLSSGTGIHSQPFRLLNVSWPMTVNVPPPLLLESVPHELAAPDVDPVIADATDPRMVGDGVVEVIVEKALAFNPQRMPNCWLVAVPDWLHVIRRISRIDAREARAVAARIVIISELAMIV